jgi:hypothetical protein
LSAAPLAIPVLQQEHLVVADGLVRDAFGHSLDADGDTAVVGAYLADVGAKTDQGAACVFVRSGTMWALQQKSKAPDGEEGDRFGSWVAIDSATILVGAGLDDVDSNGGDAGSAHVFVCSAGGVWEWQQMLFDPEGASYEQFSAAVDLDGDTALVGVPSDRFGPVADQGSACVFIRSV